MDERQLLERISNLKKELSILKDKIGFWKIYVRSYSDGLQNVYGYRVINENDEDEKFNSHPSSAALCWHFKGAVQSSK